ncbi:hypothetical protein TNCV_325061 [Trichonephila clavipes]|nr:hypothetical protein TNCV_325061 [Trichonephila clavipes]
MKLHHLELLHVKSVEAPSHIVGGVWKLGEVVPAQMPLLSVNKVARQPRVEPWPSQEAFPRPTFSPPGFYNSVLRTRRSFSRQSIHLRFGLPFLRVLIG